MTGSSVIGVLSDGVFVGARAVFKRDFYGFIFVYGEARLSAVGILQNKDALRSRSREADIALRGGGPVDRAVAGGLLVDGVRRYGIAGGLVWHLAIAVEPETRFGKISAGIGENGDAGTGSTVGVVGGAASGETEDEGEHEQQDGCVCDLFHLQVLLSMI